MKDISEVGSYTPWICIANEDISICIANESPTGDSNRDAGFFCRGSAAQNALVNIRRSACALLA